jgi:hypothetical protein
LCVGEESEVPRKIFFGNETVGEVDRGDRVEVGDSLLLCKGVAEHHGNAVDTNKATMD